MTSAHVSARLLLDERACRDRAKAIAGFNDGVATRVAANGAGGQRAGPDTTGCAVFSARTGAGAGTRPAPAVRSRRRALGSGAPSTRPCATTMAKATAHLALATILLPSRFRPVKRGKKTPSPSDPLSARRPDEQRFEHREEPPDAASATFPAIMACLIRGEWNRGRGHRRRPLRPMHHVALTP
jgi:hypothetical protein